ncbi:MAG: beta-N-acetylhexosaminidase, partial [Ignavibacteriales bacterium]|nr:beta-N-acetylhexosaminidase [Ignavibacteriales bacterium]
MMRLSFLFFCLCLAYPSLHASQGPSHPPSTRIIPAPQQVLQKTGQFKLTSSTRIVLGEGTFNVDRFAGDQINQELSGMKEKQLRIVSEENVRSITANFIYLGSPESDRGRAFLRERKGMLKEEMSDEGYFLDVSPEGVVIIAEHPAGRFYGLMSLLQLVEREKKSLVLPGVSIHDWPLQSVRGVTDDLSRGQVSTMDNFKKIIRFLARYKLNIYSPYFEDIFSFRNHPLIAKGRGEITAAEMIELDAYARMHYVEVIPIFETLGHWENILAMPQYVQYAEFPGAHTVNISDEGVYKMLDEMIGEIGAAFSSEYFNIAADESWDVGLGVNKQRVAQSDIATVHAEHYKRLFDIVKKHKKKALMYGDIILTHPEILTKIPKEVVFVDWQYHVADVYGSPSVFENAGFRYVISPAVWNFTGPFPNYINTFVNIQNLNKEGYLNGSLGILTSNWNDYGGEALRELNYYGYAWTAECAWQPLRANATDFNRRFFVDFFGSREAAMAAQSIYAIMSDPLNQMYWNELWRHPMLPLSPSPMNELWRIQSIESTMPFVQQLIQQVRTHATRNKDHLQYLEFVSRLNLWFAKKLRSGATIRRLTENIPQSADVDSVKTAVLDLARPVVQELSKLKNEFRQVWLATNREANLNWLMLRYDRQAEYWHEKMEEIVRGFIWVEPTIESQWIYHPKGNPRKRDSLATQVPRAYFRKSFILDDTSTSAKLQLLGDSHAKLWVNGNELGEVYARRSLSLTVEHQRVRVWHLSGQL